jgi:hypothetical protein
VARLRVVNGHSFGGPPYEFERPVVLLSGLIKRQKSLCFEKNQCKLDINWMEKALTYFFLFFPFYAKQNAIYIKSLGSTCPASLISKIDYINFC